MLRRRCGIATGMLPFIAIFFQKVPAPVGALFDRGASDSTQSATDQRSGETVTLAGNPVAGERTNCAAHNGTADAAAFLAMFEIGQLFGAPVIHFRITGIRAIGRRAAARIKSGVDVASRILIGPASPVRGHIAVTDERTGIFALIDPAVGIAIGALPFALVAAVLAIGPVPVTLVGRMVAPIGRRRGDDAVITDKYARVIGCLAVAIAVAITLIVAVPVDVVTGVMDDSVTVGENRIIIIARPAIAIIGLAQSVIAEIADEIAGLDKGFRQMISPKRFAIGFVIAHPAAAHVAAGLTIAFHLMHIAHALHAARIAHLAHLAGAARSGHRLGPRCR